MRVWWDEGGYEGWPPEQTHLDSGLLSRKQLRLKFLCLELPLRHLNTLVLLHNGHVPVGVVAIPPVRKKEWQRGA